MKKKKPASKPKTRSAPSGNGSSWTCAAVVVAAGSSTRMGGKVKKPFLKLRGKPVLSWTIKALGRVPGLKELVLVTRPEDRRMARRCADQARLPRSVKLLFADGGARRQDSVMNGLLATSESIGLVMIHDAARPFPDPGAIAKAVGLAHERGASILAVPVRDTVKRELDHALIPLAQKVSGQNLGSPESLNGTKIIGKTVPRKGLWLAQTPQVFRRVMLLELFERFQREAPGEEVTDDAAVCERYGHAVALVDSSSTNLKITRPEDLQIAEAYLRLGLVK
ncbi:MAG: 2-C-methyl-D-erythritol 4-phosphate cytidylyltransferase [Planctomycetota bacterium]|nr:2-C-methyl-D-erythritol 4-phosphate cytidylyltransferase [Planctomycetota bacterium]